MPSRFVTVVSVMLSKWSSSNQHSFGVLNGSLCVSVVEWFFLCEPSIRSTRPSVSIFSLVQGEVRFRFVVRSSDVPNGSSALLLVNRFSLSVRLTRPVRVRTYVSRMLARYSGSCTNCQENGQ